MPPTLSETERKYWDERHKEGANLPRTTWEEDKIAMGKFTECLIIKEKELGGKLNSNIIK